MDFFNYKEGKLFCEELPAERVATEVGTPCYLYSWRTMAMHYEKIRQAFAEAEPLICYSVKANSALEILRRMKELGAGFDIVSGGELFRALTIGADPRKLIFAGPGKSEAELTSALEHDIALFNVGSAGELALLSCLARRRDKVARVALRVNPNVDPQTHRYITTGKRVNKFGLDLAAAERVVDDIGSYPSIRLVGLHMHIGSQITQVEPYVEALTKLVAFRQTCLERGVKVDCIDIGGGFGINYQGEEAKSAEDFARQLVPLIKSAGVRLILEPGRFIVGNAGILLTRVLYVKPSGERRFVIVDAGMNDLIRPSLYDAYHRVWPVGAPFPQSEADEANCVLSDVVGPLCESGDFFARERLLPPVKSGELLAVFSAGAYGATMSSNYNSRPRAPEVLVDGDAYKVIRRRESYADLIRLELPEYP